MVFRPCIGQLVPRVFLLLSLVLLAHVAVGAEKEPGADDSSILKMGDPQLDVLWIDEKNGQYIPLETVVVDEDGTEVTLGSLIDRPTLILPIYFYCPSSCSLNLVNLATSLNKSQLKPGRDFKIIAFSFNEKENEENARIAKRNYLRLLPKNFDENDWKFLTGSKEAITAITESIGYTFKEQKDGMFIHPSALVAVAEDGMIIKYVYGSFVPGDIDMAVTEAEKGTPALSIKRFLGYCFNYAPEKSRTFFQNLKVSVLLFFALCGVLVFFFIRRSGRRKG